MTGDTRMRWRLEILLALTFAGNTLLPAGEIVVESVLISVIHSADVPARDTGVLSEILVREGTQVEAGTVLVKLDAVEAELTLKQVRRQLDIANQEYENYLRKLLAGKAAEVAASELKRAEEANKKYPETVSRTEVDRLRLVSEKAQIDIRLAEHEHRLLGMTAGLREIEVEQAEHGVERRHIRAPIAGTVVRIDSRLGEWVQPGASLVRLIDTRQLRAEAVLPAKYRHLDLSRCPVRVDVPGFTAEKTRPVEGAISFVHPEIDPVDGSFRIWAILDNREHGLRPGDSVVMRIQTDAVAEPEHPQDALNGRPVR